MPVSTVQNHTSKSKPFTQLRALAQQDARFWVVGVIFLLIYMVDRLSKMWALSNLVDRRISVVPWVELTLVSNEKFAYLSLPAWFSIIVTVVVMVVIAGFARSEFRRGQRLAPSLIFLVLLGAWSNLLDRLRFGGVVDFISVNRWSVFNLSDVYIVVGVICLLLFLPKSNTADDSDKSAPVPRVDFDTKS